MLAPLKSTDKILKNSFLDRSQLAESVPKKLKNSTEQLCHKKFHKMRPAKKERNLTGLRNQGPRVVDLLESISEFVEQEQHATVGVDGDDVDDQSTIHIAQI